MPTTVADLRNAVNNGTLTATSYPILEPLNAPEIFKSALKRFGDNYDTSPSSHLYRFLLALCGETGAGYLKKEMLIVRLEQQLANTHFRNLDRLYGNPLGLPRIANEIYSYNPETDILTTSQWSVVYGADASYRHRCLTWMRALMEGSSPNGIRLATEAAIGVDVDVWEYYKYANNPIGTNFSKTSTVNEFVVIPRTILTEEQKRDISRQLDLIKPTNTIGTIYAGTSPRSQKTVRLADASSDFFDVLHNVTGNPAVSWPEVNLSNGYWITTGTNEAPTYAFMNRQESIMYLSILGATASSFHEGYFSQEQQQLFSNLAAVTNPYEQFTPDKSFPSTIAPTNLGITWNGGGSAGNNIVVNSNYPLGYFNSNTNLVNTNVDSFWASNEDYADTTGEYGSGTYGGGGYSSGDPSISSEWLQYDLGRSRPLNYIHFEITNKPIDWTVQYSTDGATWSDITEDPDFPLTSSSVYLPSTQNPWMQVDLFFNQISARFIKINFVKRTDAFPLPTSDPIKFSVDVRNVYLMDVITTADNFVADSGVDILGNNFTTELVVRDTSNLFTGNNPYWQSKPNPSPQAVESVYFDLRVNNQPGLMEFLDTQFMDELDVRSMSDIENLYLDGQLVDEIYIDPITYGCDMHFYYSDDDTPNWDEKLWTPITRDYVLKKGFHALPRPTFMKFFKIEFSNLTAIPYTPVEFPTMPMVTFNRYPLWVQNFFLNIRLNSTKDVIIQNDPIMIDPLQFGFTKVNDSLVSNFEAERDLQTTDTTSEVSGFIENLLANAMIDTTNQTLAESKIEFSSPIMWQSDLIANLDPARALSRVAMDVTNTIVNTGWNAELTLPISTPPVQASDTDLSDALEEKTTPVMFFPQRCRHFYQVVKAPLDKKIAYAVSIRQIGFYRRDYTAPTDDAIYTETLDDTAHILSNDFIQNDWRYVVV